MPDAEHRIPRLTNFALFQVGWFLCVVGAAEGWPWLGAVAAWPIVALAFWSTPDKRRLASFLAAGVAFGLLADTLLEQAGVVRYAPSGRLFPGTAPLWILTLWALFGTLFHRALRWLLEHPLLGFFLASIGSPLSFYAGSRLGAVEFPWSPIVSLTMLGAVWACAMPLLLAWARRWDPWSPSPARSIGAAGRAGAAGCLLLLGACGVLAFSGPSKEEVRERLLALEKNRPIAAAGTTRRAVTVTWEGRGQVFDVHELVLEPESRPSGSPVLLVHGTPSSLFVWTRVLFPGESPGERGSLADRLQRRVLAPDLPGHGATRSAWGPYTFEKLVGFLEAYLDAHGVERAVIVGHSYGGEVAWRFAVEHPDRVDGLVLIASSGYRRTDAETPEEEEVLKHHPLAYWGRHVVTLASTREALEISFVGTVPDGEAQENFTLVKNRDGWRAMVELAREEEGHWEERIRQIRAPTRILWGEQDANFPIEHAERFARDIPGARLVRVPGCNHYVPVEQPAAVVEALEGVGED